MSKARVYQRRRHGVRAASTALALATLLMAGTALPQGQIRADQKEDAKNPPPAGLLVKTIREQINYIKHNLYLSLGAVSIQSYTTSRDIKLENATGLTAQAFGSTGSVFIEGGSDLGERLIPGGSLGLYLPYTGHHLAMEVLIAGPIKTTFQATGKAAKEAVAPTALNGRNAEPVATQVPAIGNKIGTLKALPPNFTIVYRPWVDDELIKPYAGIGAAYLYTYDTDVNNEVLQRTGNEPILSLSKPFACIGKVGADINLPKRWFMRLEAQYIGCATVRARLTGIQLQSPSLSPVFGDVDTGALSTSTHIHIVAYQLSFGIKF